MIIGQALPACLLRNPIFQYQINRILTNLWTAAWHRGGWRGAGTVGELPLSVPESQGLLVVNILDVLHVKLEARAQPGDGGIRVTDVKISWSCFISLTINITRRAGQYFGQIHWLRQTKLMFASFVSTVRWAVVILWGNIFTACCLILMTRKKFYYPTLQSYTMFTGTKYTNLKHWPLPFTQSQCQKCKFKV